MTGSRAKRYMPMTVTFLDMKARPAAPPPPLPPGKLAILRAEKPPVHFYRYLYDTVGEPYYWVDRRRMDDISLKEMLEAPTLDLYVLYVDGCPAGMAELDYKDCPTGLLAYFGLLPEFIGRGLGAYFLYQTVQNAWTRPITKLLVNTCTLDHPRALPLYQRMGFVPYSREDRRIELL
ncbi:GNAT superfamily N-acetyltransferase [Rhizomicrobium palustre]|uniref:GNAT superfamily N-acetyltransferase n=1 Tax=Rhizomicrobium palustre TaxID=189966 RepID=A0A846N4G8_9PROT|nr:GNAT family N-acetyltransferase [Rhizomicrobium palustre]NIK89940.1 GNAT superfamily N-acetyltransferase [Rhizomicrobium palustre]